MGQNNTQEIHRNRQRWAFIAPSLQCRIDLLRLENHKRKTGDGKLLTEVMTITFFRRVSLVFEVFQVWRFMEMLAVPYLVLQACISFLTCFRQERRISVFALFAYKFHCSHALTKMCPSGWDQVRFFLNHFAIPKGGDRAPLWYNTSAKANVASRKISGEFRSICSTFFPQ